jgi:hypothetical protein
MRAAKHGPEPGGRDTVAGPACDKPGPALLNHITIDMLRAAFFDLRRRAAPGIDAVTWDMYEKDHEEKLRDLHRRVHAGAYRALPSRQTYIPKAMAGNGRSASPRSRTKSSRRRWSSF